MNDREIIESMDYARVFNELKKDVEKPIEFASYKLGEAIPKDLKTALPSIEDIETNLKRSLLQDREELSTEDVDKLDEKDGKEKF